MDEKRMGYKLENTENLDDMSTKEKKGVLNCLVSEVSNLLSGEPALVYKDSEPVFIVGGLNGDLKALDYILKEFEVFCGGTIVFLGEYLDTEHHSLDILIRLFQLKLKLPDNVILLQSRFELMDNYANISGNNDGDLFSHLSKLFREMPVAAVINGSVCCINHGVPEGLTINSIKKGKHCELIDNDPFQHLKHLPPEISRDSESFRRSVYEEFMQCNWLKLIVHSRSYDPYGYHWWHDGKLLSLFSTPGQHEYSYGAFALIKGGQLSLLSFGVEDEDEYHLIDVSNGPYWSLLYNFG